MDLVSEEEVEATTAWVSEMQVADARHALGFDRQPAAGSGRGRR
jgi:hypothetical protein